MVFGKSAAWRWVPARRLGYSGALVRELVGGVALQPLAFEIDALVLGCGRGLVLPFAFALPLSAVSYAPAPGYAGPDRFDVTLQPDAIGITVNVAVMPARCRLPEYLSHASDLTL